MQFFEEAQQDVLTKRNDAYVSNDEKSLTVSTWI